MPPWEKYAAPAGRQATIISNPFRARDEGRKDEDQSMERERLRLAREASDRAAAAETRANEAADRQRREFEATHNADGTPKATAGKLANIPAGAATGVQENLKALRSIDEALASLRTRPQSIGTGTGMLGDKFTQWHDPEGTATRSLVAAVGAQKIHDLSGAAVSASEAPRFTPFVPTVTDTPEVATQKLLRFRSELQGQIREAADYYTPDNGYRPYKTPGLEAALAATPEQANSSQNDQRGPIGAIAGALPGANPPSPSNSSGGAPRSPWDQPNAPAGQTVASGAFREVQDKRAASMIDSMVNAGASKAEIDAILQKQGFGPINPAEWSAVQAQIKSGRPYSGTNAVRREPLSLLQQAAGSAPGAFTAQMANAATAGTVGMLAGEKGQGALDAMSQTSPNASMAGSILGGIAGAGTVEAGVAARAPTAIAQYAPRAADALYGAVTGFNGAQDGNGLRDAAIGAGLGVAGGAIGDGAMNVASSLARGVRDPAVQYLREAGVPMTVGQILSQSGPVGRGVKKVEDALTSIPGVGNMIEARRMEGLQGFNHAAFDIGAETTGNQVQDYGAAGLGQLQGAVQQSYRNALDPVRIDTNDPQLGQDLADVVAGIQRIPNVNGAQDAAMAGLQSRVDGAIDPLAEAMTGRGFQEAYRGLARTGRERANGDYGHEIGQSMRGGQDALAAALERQNPGAYQGFADANQGNRRMNVLAQAVDAAKSQEDQLFTPAQLNRADAASATRLTGRVNSASGNRPFAELANAGQAILPSKLPDSGTATRALVTGLGVGGVAGGGAGYLAGDTGAGAGAGLGVTLALMAGGSRASQRSIERLLLERPDLALRVGQQLEDYAGRGGTVGTSAAVNGFLPR